MLRHQIGFHFDFSFCLRLGFYWFGIVVFYKWQLPITSRYISGLAFSWRPNRSACAGDFIWLKQKEWLKTRRY